MQTPEPTAAQDRGCLSEQAPDTVSGGGTPERDGGRSVTTASPRSFEPAPPPPPDSKTPKRPRSSAAQTWLVQVFSFHADYIARDGGVRLPSGWEPLRIEATGGNKYRVYARKQEVAT